MRHLAILALWLLVVDVHAQGIADDLRSQNLFRAKCASCHSVACNRSGTKLEGVIGRRAAGATDFRNYTVELRNSGIVWSEANLDEYIGDPGKVVPGTSMTAAGKIESAAERRDIIAHIKRQDRSIDLCL